MKYRLDIDDDTPFDGWAFVLFQTTTPAYMLADSLNRLYDYRLARIDDLTTPSASWPLYTFEDYVAHLKFFLLESPSSGSAWETGDKLLAVAGESAEAEADALCADFNDPEPYDPADLLAAEHAEMLNRLLAGFTIVSPIDFAQMPAHSKRRTIAEQCCREIIDAIEKRHLDMNADERRRLSENFFLAN